MSKPKGAPEVVRSIYLLWGRHPAPSRSGLDVGAIVAAGIELADAEGLSATSMRRIAERLSTSPMSLYSHVPGKDDLTALMVDSVLAGLYSDTEEPRRAGDWRAGLHLVAERNLALYARHPWLLDVEETRTYLGPNMTLKYEAELGPLDGSALSDVEADAALSLVLELVAGSARTRREASAAQEGSGVSDAEHWAMAVPALEQVTEGLRLPRADRVGSAVGSSFAAPGSADFTLDFGLRMLLDGLAHRLGESPSAP
ncbi:TetR/AcrR family transcriptional regulator [Nocardiopsis coralliicola]